MMRLMGSLGVGILAVGAAAAALGADPVRFDYHEVHMGVPVKLALYSADKDAANTAAKAVYAQFAEINHLLSDYDPESELSQLSSSSPHEKPVHVSEPLWFVLSRSQQLAEETDGSFDVTVGPLVKLWRRSRRQRELPSADRLATAKVAVGYRYVKLDPKVRTVQLTRPHTQLDLGGIAMGYAVDEGLRILKAHGIDAAMIDASGDIGVSNPPPGMHGWRIGIAPLDANAPPSRYLLLANAAVTTSGDAFQFVEIAGKRYSHIVDPQTGLGLTTHSAVTIVAPDCITADSYATAVNVLGHEKGIAFIEKQPGVAAIIMRGSDQVPEEFTSSTWDELSFEDAAGNRIKGTSSQHPAVNNAPTPTSR